MTIAHDGHSYELTSRYSQPQSSAAQLYRNDPYLTQRFIAHLPIEPDTWLRLLGNIGLRNPNIGYGRLGDIHQQVADAIARNDINLYRLPRLDETNCLRGKKDTGLCIIQGPKPHCATRLAPLSIDSPQAASELLNELGITPSALIAHLRQQHLCEDDNSLNPLDDVLTRLAKGELLAYKIPLPPPAAPKKAVEFVPAAGPGYEPVTLGPESAAPKAPSKKAPPQSLEEAEQRLLAAGPAVREAKAQGKPLPPSPYSLEDKQAVVAKGINERYLVRVIETEHAKDEGYIGKVRDEGHSISWTAPFSMVEHGDTDAEALLKAFGTRYVPGRDYTVLIIDRDKMNEIGDVQTVIPTKKNLINLIAKNPQISTLSPAEVEDVLSDDLAPDYYRFAKKAALEKANDTDMRIELAHDMGFSSQETGRLLKRQRLADQVSAWEEFTGNGMTLDTSSNEKAYGPVEVVLLDKKPLTIGDLNKRKAIKRINC